MKFKVLVEKLDEISPKHPIYACGFPYSLEPGIA